METSRGGEEGNDARTRMEMFSTFNKFVFPVALLALLVMVFGTATVVYLVSTPLKQGTPPPLPADVTDEYRVYSFYRSDMYNLYIQSQNKSLSVNVLQIGIGMILGLLCVFIGTAMCWFGVTGAVTLEASDGSKKLNVQTAQIGVVLLVGGIILVSLSVYKGNRDINSGDLSAAAPRVRNPTSSTTGMGGGGSGSAGGMWGLSSDLPPPMTKSEVERTNKALERFEKQNSMGGTGSPGGGSFR